MMTFDFLLDWIHTMFINNDHKSQRSLNVASEIIMLFPILPLHQ